MKKQFQPDHKYDRFKLWKWISAYQATAKGAHDRSKTKTALVKRFDFSFFDHGGGGSQIIHQIITTIVIGKLFYFKYEQHFNSQYTRYNSSHICLLC